MPKSLRVQSGWWFAATILLSAFLVFQVQPVISKTILPWFGGSPAVWTTCMLFFQLVLFAGYAYAHLTTRLLAPRWQGVLHFSLIAASLCVLPLAPDTSWKPSGAEDPTLRILAILLVHVGLPYFLLSATGPLLQVWFTAAVPSGSPYRLYALSNVGSLSALLTYPFLVEPSLTTHAQGQAWSVAFCGFALCCAYLAAQRYSRTHDSGLVPDTNATPTAACPSPKTHVLGWLLLPAFASIFLLATTNHICQDIAVIPFLWIVPLSLYLLTFIICFDRESWYSRRWCGGLAVLGLVVLHGVALARQSWSMPLELGIYFALVFLVCMVCHGELVRLKPAPRYLTSFYLMTSAGGALGGLTVGVLCPWLFSSYLEIHISLLVAAALSSGVFLLDARDTWLGDSPPRRSMAATSYLAVFLLVAIVQFGHQASGITASVRNFYGVLRLEETEAGPRLLHGRIVHGYQLRDPSLARLPTAYYGEHSGAGVALRSARAGQPQRVGVVGLGCGTVATYGTVSDYYRFYEINPAVIELARNSFTYLKDCAATTDVVLGDARISMEREMPQNFNVLLLDAFSGDSVPTHLLTDEAFAVYRRHLQANGVLAIHISNQHVDLEPVVQRLADQHGFECFQVVSHDQPPRVLAARWMLLTKDRERLASHEWQQRARPVSPRQNFPLWTDQYTNIVQLLRIY